MMVLSSCGLSAKQRVAMTQFGGATADFAELTSKEFIQTRQDVIEMNTMRFELGDPLSTQVNEIGQSEPVLEGNLTTKRVKIRVDAVNALREYGELLNTLATSSQQVEIRNAAESFVASLKKVEGVSLSAQDGNAIVAAVQAVGGLLIESMRKKAAVNVVKEARPHVMKVINLVFQSFDRNDVYWSLEYDTTIVALTGAAVAAQKGLKAKPSLPDMALIKNAKATAVANMNRSKAISKEVQGACEKMRSASKNLQNILLTDKITTDDIDEYFAQIEDFITLYKILSGK
jgi:hypothetical protein